MLCCTGDARLTTLFFVCVRPLIHPAKLMAHINIPSSSRVQLPLDVTSQVVHAAELSEQMMVSRRSVRALLCETVMQTFVVGWPDQNTCASPQP